MNDDELDRLIHRYFEQALSPEEEILLWNLIRVDKAAADRFVDQSEMESALVESLKAEEAAPPDVATPMRGSRRRTQVVRPPPQRAIWPLFLAAGLMLGFVALLTQSVEKTPSTEVTRRSELPIGRPQPSADVEKPKEAAPPPRREEAPQVGDLQKPVAPAPRPVVVQTPTEERSTTPTPAEKPEPVPGEKPVPVTEVKVAEAKIEKVEGEVVRVGDVAGPAAAGQPLASGQGLDVRGLKSSAVVVLADGTRVELRPDTRLEKLLLSADQKRFQLTRGTAIATVAKQALKQSVAFQTAHAEVIVIGTKLSVEIGSESTRVEVQEGRVKCRRLSDTMFTEIGAGRFAVAGKGPAPVARPTPVVRSFQDGVAPTPDYAGSRDCWLSSLEPNQNFATGNLLRLQRLSASQTTLIRWDVGSIPPGSRVISAELSFWVTGKLVGNCKIFDVRRAWEESEATWKTAVGRQGWTTAGAQGDGDRGLKPIGLLAPASTGQYTMALNDLGIAIVQEWFNAPNTNNGILVAGPDANEWNLDSRESATPERRPKLTVTYIPAK